MKGLNILYQDVPGPPVSAKICMCCSKIVCSPMLLYIPDIDFVIAQSIILVPLNKNYPLA